ncbi:hypothetical protein Trydic_g5634 [Trypoxylus dichotomus]
MQRGEERARSQIDGEYEANVPARIDDHPEYLARASLAGAILGETAAVSTRHDRMQPARGRGRPPQPTPDDVNSITQNVCNY